MLDRCYNPTCSRELRYLRDGRVVRVMRVEGDDTRPEHYWLCGVCSETHEFLFTPDGKITVALRIKKRSRPELVVFNDDDVELHWQVSGE